MPIRKRKAASNAKARKAVTGSKGVPAKKGTAKQAYEHQEPRASTVRESGLTYSYTPGALLTGVADKPENGMTPLEKMEISRRRISKWALEQLKARTALDYDKLAYIFSVARATLINKKGEDRFSHVLSEKIVGLADIYSYGYEVFEDEDRFNAWMFRPNRALNGQMPYELMDSQFGREEIKNIIGRIAYGVYS